jgi:transcriptional regulator with XRE-family HTH domain
MSMENIQHNPVRDTRAALKISQEEMAQRLGCSISSARRFEYDGTIPRNRAVMGNLQRLAKQAGVSLEDAGAKAEATQ